MNTSTTIRIAFRELRGGREALRVFVLCLSLGVAALAGVGSVVSAIEEGLARTGRDALGGDLELRLVHRFGHAEELAYFESLGTVSHIVDFRGNVSRAGNITGDRAFTQIKAVDDAYPLYGRLELDPPLPLSNALGVNSEGIHGMVAAPELAARLDLELGDRVQFGTSEFEYRAAILVEPDRSVSGMRFGPRVIVALEAISDSGLLAPGSLFYSHYRIRLPAAVDLGSLRAKTAERFPDAGWRWRDWRAGAPGAGGFVRRIGSFLSLVGLSALALGGVGAGAAVRAYLQRKTATIAILRTVGATRGTVAAVYLVQTLAIASVGVAIGLALGSGLPTILGPLFSQLLPLPAVFGFYPAPLAKAALAGYLTAVLFALLPLAHACEIPAAALFRDEAAPTRSRLRLGWVIALLLVAGALISLAFLFSGVPQLAAWFVASFAFALALLALTGNLAARLSSAMSGRLARAPASLRRAVAQIGGSRADARGIAVSIGTAVSILVAIALTEYGLRSAITMLGDEEIPSYFVLDIPNGQVEAFRESAMDAGATQIVSAPMLRGFVTALNGIPANEVEIAPEASWVLRGDRGLSYASVPPDDSTLEEGDWWPPDYAGPPLVSFAAEEGRELGLGVGSTITVNVLGRPLIATVANLREVAWRGMGMNFLMVFDQGALSEAPHAHIATVYLPESQGLPFLRILSDCCPSATAISVRDGLEQARKVIGQIASAAFWGSAVTLLTGLAVLVGVAAAGQRRQTYESAILKSLGATRREILTTILLKWAILGAMAAIFAIGLGTLGAWAILRFVMELDFAFSPALTVGTVLAGVLVSLAAGLAFAGAAVRASPAELLRTRG